MPPSLALQRALVRSPGLRSQPAKAPSICLFCSFTPRISPSSPSPILRPSRKPLVSLPEIHRRSHTASPSLNSKTRQDLYRALLDLQTHGPNYVNLPRLQLALRNLSEPPGHESVRVAFLSVSTGTASSNNNKSSTTAKRLLRLALADPLTPAAEWEVQLEAHDVRRHPLIVRVAGKAQEEERDGTVTVASIKEHVIPELRVSTPLLRGAGVEMLVAEVAAALPSPGGKAVVDDALLVPMVDVAATTAGHVAAVGTPVHMAVLVGDGMLGAAAILGMPVVQGWDVIMGAVNFTRVGKEDLADCPLVAVNVDAGREALELFRADVGNAMKFKALWSEANVGRISEWLQKSVLSGGEGFTKTPVRNLIDSLLRNARAAVQEEQARDLATESQTEVSPVAIADLDKALAEWAQNAHEELQQQLDLAFSTRPWSKLGWWKLFWRADDVGMMTSEMVALRFLPEAEKAMIYLAGRMQEAGIAEGQQGQPLYAGPALPQSSTGTERQDTVAPNIVAKWPTHIPFTRNYLQEKTVPALQALAQKLVVQAASLSGLSTALAGLSYLSSLGAYECGAIAALGIALSFRRFQGKWDAAREYWEEEVREEGRKAIRATEASVAEVLNQAGKTPDPRGDRTAHLEELNMVEEIIKRAEEAFAQM
ncbi:hypothetical protein N657DRAFT_641795, partial [Parathielavia appendiculata]